MLMKKKHAISTTIAAILVVIALIVGVAATYYYVVSTVSPSTSVSTSTSTSTSTFTSTSTSTSTVTTTSSTSKTTAPTVTPSFVTDNTYVSETAANYQYLDPQVAYYSYDYGVLNQQYESLLWWNGTDSSTPVPWLASNMTESPGGTSYTFGLRQGIKFQDGQPFNATAVCFSLNRLLVMDSIQPTGGPSGPGWIVQQVLNQSFFSAFGGTGAHTPAWVKQVLAENFCQVLSTYKVQLNLIHPSASFTLLISGPWADMVSPKFVVSHDYPAAIGPSGINYTMYYDHTAGNGTTYLDNSYDGSLAGTGPYMLTSVNPTTYEIKMTANTNYWGGPPGYQFGKITPTIKNIDLLVVADTTTRILDMKGLKAAHVAVTPDNVFSLLNRTSYDNAGQYVSDTPYVTFMGPNPYFNQGWFEFNTNVTTSAGGPLATFQPFSDLRFRLAVADSANVSAVLDSITYGLQKLFNWMEPPGTLPTGSYLANQPTAWNYNLTASENLLKSACASPLTSFTFYNGTNVPAGVVNNNCQGKTISLYYQAGATVTEKILSTVAANLNAISSKDKLGLTFTVVPVPAGTLYTLAGQHTIQGYWAGWLDDYNWAIDWTSPMFASTGTYPYWSQWNFSKWNDLNRQAIVADQNGNVSGVVAATVALSQSNNQLCWYWYHGSQLDYYFINTWVHGYFYNPNFVANAMPYIAVMRFAPPASS